MQTMPMSKHEAQALRYSICMLVLGVAAIAAFVLRGAGTIFYVLAAVALAAGFYMAYHLSKTPTAAQPTTQRRASKKSR